MAIRELTGTGLPGVSYVGDTESVAIAGVSNVYLINHGQFPTVTVVPETGGSAKVQTTLSAHSVIEAGLAVWEDWRYGIITDASTDVTDTLVGQVSGLRLSPPAGAAVAWTVVG